MADEFRFSSLEDVTRRYRGDSGARFTGPLYFPQDPYRATQLADFFLRPNTGIRLDSVVGTPSLDHSLGTSEAAAAGTYQLALITTSNAEGPGVQWFLGADGTLWNESQARQGQAPLYRVTSPSRSGLVVGQSLALSGRDVDGGEEHSFASERIAGIIAIHSDTPSVRSALENLKETPFGPDGEVPGNRSIEVAFSNAQPTRYPRFGQPGPGQLCRLSVNGLAGDSRLQAWEKPQWGLHAGTVGTAIYSPGVGYSLVDHLQQGAVLHTTEVQGPDRLYESMYFFTRSGDALRLYCLRHTDRGLALLDVDGALESLDNPAHRSRAIEGNTISAEEETLFGTQTHSYELSLGEPCRPLAQPPDSPMLRRARLGDTVSAVFAVQSVSTSPTTILAYQPDGLLNLHGAERMDEPPLWGDVVQQLDRLGISAAERASLYRNVSDGGFTLS